MKEIKVATLSKEEVKELKEVIKMKIKTDTLMVQTRAAHDSFWRKLLLDHSLSPGDHYIVGNSIYKQEV